MTIVSDNLSICRFSYSHLGGSYAFVQVVRSADPLGREYQKDVSEPIPPDVVGKSSIDVGVAVVLLLHDSFWRTRWNKTSVQRDAFRASSWLWQRPLELRARDRICQKGPCSRSPGDCSAPSRLGTAPSVRLSGEIPLRNPCGERSRHGELRRRRRLPQRPEMLTDAVPSRSFGDAFDSPTKPLDKRSRGQRLWRVENHGDCDA